jgi:predicted nucleotidyltransferase component of viral defense system
MGVSREFVERCAAATGFDGPTLEKVSRLGTIAAEVAAHPSLRGALVLKGGTAINLCHGPPTRLSVDLDYNFVGCEDREGMVFVRPGVERALVELLRRMGYAVQHSAEAAAARKFHASYRSVMGPPDRIEVDINYLWRVPLAGVREAELWQPGALARPRITVVSQVELWVGKMLAFLDRTAPRDAWDVSRLQELAPDTFGPRLFRQWFVAMAFVLDHPLHTYGLDVLRSRWSSRRIDEQLRPMLICGTRLDSAELLSTAWNAVAPLLEPSRDEAAFSEAAQAGRVDASLLFGVDREASRRFESHPQVLWKLRNLCQRLDPS